VPVWRRIERPDAGRQEVAVIMSLEDVASELVGRGSV